MLNSFVDIKGRDDELKKQVSGIKDQLTAVGMAIGTAVGNLAAGAIARASSAVTGFFSSGIKGAVALQDSLAATSAIFGDAAGVITSRADEMARQFGTVKTEFIDAAQGFGAAFKAIGTPVDDAAKLGNQLAKLAMDMASFKGTANADAFTALAAALRGEFNPLERYNVMLSAAAIEQEALSTGLIKSAKDMDEAAKKQATLSLIMKKSVDMQGDLERTAGDTGNAWRKFTGTVQNTADSIGTSLMPAISAVTTALGDMAQWVASSVESSKDAIKGWADSIAAAIRAVPDAWDTFVAGLAVAFLKVEEWSTNTMAVFATIPENLRRIGEWVANNWVKLLADGFTAVGQVFANLAKNLTSAWDAFLNYLKTGKFEFDWTPLLKDFKATADALPELLRPNLVSMDGAIAAVDEDLNRKIEGRAKAAADAARSAAAPGKAAAAAAAGKQSEFKAETSGIAEFAYKLRESALSGKDKVPEQQLEEQTKTRVATEKIAELLGGGIAATLG